jgi:acetolactate synthase-1/2/3 large subunit
MERIDMGKPRNGAQWFVKTLREQGVEYVFTLCGNGLNPFYDACLDHRVKVVDVRNEQAAAYMADAWGRLTRRIGVVAVSSGPGHTNALTGLANAWWDGGPMLLISGCSGQAMRGMDNFQELDQVGMAAPVCKHAAMVQLVQNLPQETHKALAMAVSGRPGPVHLTIPEDVLRSPIDAARVRTEAGPAIVEPRGAGDRDLIHEAVKLLSRAKRPFMVVGSGAFYAQAADALRRFAELTDIPIVSHIWDRSCVEQAMAQYVGVTNGELNHAMRMVSQADVVLTLGARVDYRLGHGRPPSVGADTKLVRVDIDPEEVTRTVTPEVGIVGDPRSVLRQMAAEWPRTGGKSHTAWLRQVRRVHDALPDKWAKLGHEDVCPVPSIRICREVKRFLDRDVTFLLDAGNMGRWAHMTLFDRHPSHWLTCGASGVVGWGIPGAVAAKLANPEKPVLLLSGDGAAGFTLGDIETALRFGTPYVAVVAHDAAWGIVADGQPEGRHVASELGEIRFDRVAQALGARGVFIESPKQLGPAIEAGLREDTVTFIHVPTQLAGVSHWEKRFGKRVG